MSRYETYSERYADMKDARPVVENPDHKVLSITYDTEQDLEQQPHEPIIPSVTDRYAFPDTLHIDPENPRFPPVQKTPNFWGVDDVDQ